MHMHAVFFALRWFGVLLLGTQHGGLHRSDDCKIEGMTIDGIPVVDLIAAYGQKRNVERAVGWGLPTAARRKLRREVR